MRAWTADEARLVEASRRVEEQRKAQELSRKRLLRNFVYALAGALVVSLAASGFAWIERGEAKWQAKKAQDNEAEAKKQTQIAKTNEDEAKKQTQVAKNNAAEAKRQTAKVLTTAGVTALEQGQSTLAMHQFAEAIKAVDEDILAQESNRLRLGMLVRGAPGLRAILTGDTAAFSPDGKRVVTVLWNTVRVWDAESGKTLATLQGHTAAVFSAAFSPDGKRIVTASYDKTRGSGTPTPARPSPPSRGTPQGSSPPRSAPTASGSSPPHGQHGAGLGRRIRQDPRHTPGAHRRGHHRRVQPRRQAGRHGGLSRQDGAGLGRRDWPAPRLT